MKYPGKLFLSLLIFAALLVLTGIYWYGYQHPSIGIDDANIYFVYMKHLAEGKGLVWNPGGERVEGFTSLLWTLLGGLLYKISPDRITTLLLATCFLLSFFTLYGVTRFARKLNGTENKVLTASDLIILALLILPRGFMEWNVLSLMETPLWMFLLTSISLQLGNYYLPGKRINIAVFSLLVVLINLTRPESLAFNFLFIGILFIMLRAEEGWKAALRKTLLPLVAHIGSLAALIGWRLSYFGYPLPNTYYAKVSSSIKENILSGVRYVLRLFYFYPYTAFLLVMVLFFGAAILLRKKRGQQPAAWTLQEKIALILGVIVCAGFGLPVLAGGDHFIFGRFFQPILPLLALSACNFALWKQYAGVTIRSSRRAVAALLLAFLFSLVFLSKLTLSDFFTSGGSGIIFPEFEVAVRGRTAGNQLNETFAACKRLPSIGAMATGGVGYTYNGNTIDLLGLNNTIMAHATGVKTGLRDHASFTWDGFWKLRPEIFGAAHGGEAVQDSIPFVLYENEPGFRNSLMYSLLKGIFDDEAFRKAYTPALVKYKNNDYSVFGYYANTFLSSLDPTVYTIKKLERTSGSNSSTSKM
ncbi:MAG: hypothetical protein INR73_11295 [Williamsia sp.]|nr:hypothetical protein [Williamsia sp.]